MKSVISVIVLAALAILLAVSNPGPEAHKQAIRDAVYKGQPIASMLGIGVLSSNLATYDSYLLFSDMMLDGRRVTLGLFGKVWVDAANLPTGRAGAGK